MTNNTEQTLENRLVNGITQYVNSTEAEKAGVVVAASIHATDALEMATETKERLGELSDTQTDIRNLSDRIFDLEKTNTSTDVTMDLNEEEVADLVGKFRSGSFNF